MKKARQFLVHWQGLLALWILLFMCGIALAAPILAPRAGTQSSSAFKIVPSGNQGLPAPPDGEHILGTIPISNRLQEADVFFTLIWGTRSALSFGLVATAIVSVLGATIGALSSYLGGTVGGLILRITDAFLAFPLIAGIILFDQLTIFINGAVDLGPLRTAPQNPEVDTVMLALVCFSWMPYARLIHADMERVRRADFIVAAQAIGIPPARIILRHLIPNAISNIFILAMRDVGGFVLLQATFSFLGVGGGSAWGQILAMGRNWILGRFGNPFEYWWVFLPVTCALVAFGIGWSLLGDYLNEWFNPRLRDFGWD